MQFNSFSFALFLVLALTAYWLARSNRARHGVLLTSSLFFYASWNPPYLLLLLACICFNYYAALGIAQHPRFRAWLLTSSILVNVGILAFYKYANFLLESFSPLWEFIGGSPTTSTPLAILLPLGISFYTFQAMSYTIDVYRGTAPIRSLFTFATYLSFFPQLVAGPIVRIAEMEQQLATPRTVSQESIVRGINRILAGLVKKVVFADWLAVLAEPVFASPQGFSPETNLVALYAYTFQIFFDFSGYCDIAIGCALLFGFRLPENFDRPYLATNIAEYWRRWHITFSSWLRDYLYISLGGNRKKTSRVYANLMITMLIGGLWHGASWSFVLWGGLHGMYLVVHRVWRSFVPQKTHAPFAVRAAGVLTTFNLVAFAFILFRCAGLEEAGQMIQRIAEIFASGSPSRIAGAVLVSPALLAIYAGLAWLKGAAGRAFPRTWYQAIGWGITLALGVALLSLFGAPPAEFIYFAF